MQWRILAGAVSLATGLALVGTATLQMADARGSQREMQAAGTLAVRGETPVLSVAQAHEVPQVEPSQQHQETPPATPPQQGEPIFRLIIPRIGVDYTVVYGSTEKALKRGPGLVERTAFPGEPGNAVVAAHRDYYFWALGQLEQGDEVIVTEKEATWRYQVTGRRVINEWATEVLEPTPTPTMTLITCWPLIYAGRSPERLAIFTSIIDIKDENVQIK